MQTHLSILLMFTMFMFSPKCHVKILQRYDFTVLCFQDMNNSDLNNSPGGVSGGGYRAPGGPVSSPPFYRVHGGDLSPRHSIPTHLFTQTDGTPTPPSYSFTKLSPAGGAVSPSAGRPGKYLDPQLLVHKSADELPQGVDPSQREVGAQLKISYKWYNNIKIIMCGVLISV